ncbi:Transforming growth factor beta receptor type 3 [Varanus komodoensis]|nr:Transforming growth factor beta receptor type 3 [Varanus komodoensis]
MRDGQRMSPGFFFSQSPTAWHPPTCLPTTATAPQPVLGFWELLRRGIGCSSRERSATGRDVHAVSLRRGVPARGQVSPGSRVSAAGPVASSEAEFLETPRELLKWARRKHGGVTSLAEYRGVNTVYLHLGADGTAPATCRLRRHFFTAMHFASERHRQPLKVCLNSDPPQDLEVHIILSKGAAPRPNLARLTVELHAAGRSRRRGLFLILKSEGPAQWMVQAQHLTGQLHVLASHKVVVSSTDVDLPLTVTQHMPPGLADVKDLLQYAADQKLPAVTSYTEAERASLATYDLCLGFTIQQCFISPSSDPLVTSPYLLIQHGCAADIHVNLSKPEQAVQGQALPPGYQERQRLSFLLQPRSNDSIHFLHCRLTLCSREPHDPTKPKGPVPKCRDESEACKEEEEPASERFQRMVTKPIIVTIGSPVRAATPGLKRDSLLASQQGKLLKDASHSQKTQPVPRHCDPPFLLLSVSSNLG